MAWLKVLSLTFSMKYMVEESEHELTKVPDGFPLIGRDGYYCRGEDVWFEYQGCGYLFHRTLKSRPDFEYALRVNDEAILMDREVLAMKTILKTARSGIIKNVLRERLNLHKEALYLRNIKRQLPISASQWKHCI